MCDGCLSFLASRQQGLRARGPKQHRAGDLHPCSMPLENAHSEGTVPLKFVLHDLAHWSHIHDSLASVPLALSGRSTTSAAKSNKDLFCILWQEHQVLSNKITTPHFDYERRPLPRIRLLWRAISGQPKNIKFWGKCYHFESSKVRVTIVTLELFGSSDVNNITNKMTTILLKK